MPWTHFVVAVSDHEQGARASDAPAEVLEQIEGRFVRPMHVFEYQKGVAALQLIEGCAEDCIATAARGQRRQQRALRLPRNVVQRAQRTGREERIAGAP